MESTISKNFRKGFTTITNDVYEYKLSLQALGLYFFIVSRSPTWRFSVKGTMSVLGEGKRRIESAIEELEQKGLLFRDQLKFNGKFTSAKWIVTDTPFDFGNNDELLPMTQNVITQNAIPQNVSLLKTKEFNTKEVINKNIISDFNKNKKEKTVLTKEQKKLSFRELVEKEAEKDKYPEKLYKEFYAYWTLSDDLGNGLMNFELEKKKGKAFNIAQRLATFWSRKTEVQQHEMRKEEENRTPSQPNLFTDLAKSKSFN